MPESCDALQFLSRNGLQTHGADAEVVWEQQTAALLTLVWIPFKTHRAIKPAQSGDSGKLRDIKMTCLTSRAGSARYALWPS